MQITVEIRRNTNRENATLGFADVTIAIHGEGEITIRGYTIHDGSKGMWVGCPEKLGKDSQGQAKYWPVVVQNKAMRKTVTAAVLDEWDRISGEKSRQAA